MSAFQAHVSFPGYSPSRVVPVSSNTIYRDRTDTINQHTVMPSRVMQRQYREDFLRTSALRSRSASPLRSVLRSVDEPRIFRYSAISDNTLHAPVPIRPWRSSPLLRDDPMGDASPNDWEVQAITADSTPDVNTFTANASFSAGHGDEQVTEDTPMPTPSTASTVRAITGGTYHDAATAAMNNATNIATYGIGNAYHWNTFTGSVDATMTNMESYGALLSNNMYQSDMDNTVISGNLTGTYNGYVAPSHGGNTPISSGNPGASLANPYQVPSTSLGPDPATVFYDHTVGNGNIASPVYQDYAFPSSIDDGLDSWSSPVHPRAGIDSPIPGTCEEADIVTGFSRLMSSGGLFTPSPPPEEEFFGILSALPATTYTCMYPSESTFGSGNRGYCPPQRPKASASVSSNGDLSPSVLQWFRRGLSQAAYQAFQHAAHQAAYQAVRNAHTNMNQTYHHSEGTEKSENEDIGDYGEEAPSETNDTVTTGPITEREDEEMDFTFGSLDFTIYADEN